MNTAGHHCIASEVGEKMLGSTLARLGYRAAHDSSKPIRLGAFYLGNWLTDVSQAVDPVAYRAASEYAWELMTSIKAAFERWVEDTPSWIDWALDTDVGKSLLSTTRAQLDEAQKALEEAVNALVGKGTDGALADGFRAAFRFVGYVKFVMDDNGNEGKMDKESFFFIFDKRYTQYYPYQHLDRPATGESAVGETLYADTPGEGPRNGRVKVGSVEHDLYEYLRTDLEIIAGMLSSLDGGLDPCRQSWAPATFHPFHQEFCDENGSTFSIGDDVPEWNLELSKLGHALHLIEDFFAHSTFVEHTSGSLPKTYRQFSRMEDGDIIAKRLKKWKMGHPPDQWEDLPNDPHVVTGYFDFRDTVVSLGHILDEAFGDSHEKVGQTADRLIEYEYKKLLMDTLDFVSDPKTIWEDNDPSKEGYDANKANEAVAWIREKGGRDLHLVEKQETLLNKTLGYVLTHPSLKSIDQRAKDSFQDAVLTFGQVVGGIGLSWTLYKSIRMVTEFFTAPWVFLRDFLKDTVYEQLVKYGKVYLKNFAFNMLGADRVGCHSLIAKDTGPEVLYKASANCAKTIHWHVCNVLARHSRHRAVEVCRQGAEMDIKNIIAVGEWIDWLELIETFLAHPLADLEPKYQTIEVPTRKVHVTRRTPGSVMSSDSLASLADEYSATLYTGPGSPGKLTWRMIAEANFPVSGLGQDEQKRRINRYLSETRQGLVVSDGVNYAFRPDLRLVIPWQKHTITVPYLSDPSGWWYQTIVDGHEKGRSYLRHDPIIVTHDSVVQRIDKGNELLEKAKSEYQP